VIKGKTGKECLNIKGYSEITIQLVINMFKYKLHKWAVVFSTTTIIIFFCFYMHQCMISDFFFICIKVMLITIFLNFRVFSYEVVIRIMFYVFSF